MTKALPLTLAVLAAMTIAHAQQTGDAALMDRARALHKQVPLIDGHNDYPWAVRENVQRDIEKLDIAKPQPTIHTDIARLKAGGVGGQFWSVYTPSDYAGQTAVTATLEQIDIVHQMMRKYPETFELALTAADVERIFKSGKIASLIGMEGGHSIDNSLAALRMFHSLGARYMTLTHSKNTPWADAATDAPQHGGLTSLWRAGRPRDELARDARRPQSRLARHDGGRHPRQHRAGDLFPLLGAGGERRPAQRA